MCVRTEYVPACCCIRDFINFDMQHDHVLKNINFDHQIRRVGGRWGSEGKKLATMLLHVSFPLT